MSENSLSNGDLRNIVFVWCGDQKPDDGKVNRLAEHSRLINFVHVTNLFEATTVFDKIGFLSAEVLHTPSVPSNALTYFGGKVIR